MVKSAANAFGAPIALEKVTDYAEMARLGIVSTPGIVIDGKIVHAGGIPKKEDLLRWLQA